jgi:hypothetical protein
MKLFLERSGAYEFNIALNICPRPLVVLLTLIFVVAMSWAHAQAPNITNISPLSGPIGTIVTISGTNFSATTTDNVVFFGAVKGTVTAATATALTVTVPPGATEQPISVMVNGLKRVSYFVFHVTFSDGSILFGNPALFPAGDMAKVVVIADVDGDGKPDLLTANSGSHTVSVIRNVNGTGTITTASFADKIDLPVGTGPVDLVVGDIDGDGRPDVMTSSLNTATISLIKNTSTPGVVSFAERIDIARSPFARGIALGDLDGDGKPELVSVGTDGTSIHTNLAPAGTIDNTTFSTSTQLPSSGSNGPVTVDDVDNDGKQDLIVATSVMRNTSSGGIFSFAPKVTVAEGTSAEFAGDHVTLTDLDGDGLRDMVLTGAPSGVYVARNISTSGSSIAFEPYFYVTTTLEITSATAGDCDGDGKPDIVVGSSMNRILIFKNQASTGSLDRSSLGNQTEFALGLPNMSASHVALGDLNGDSKPDVLASATDLMVLENGVTPVPTVEQVITFDPISSPKPYGTVFNLVAVSSSGLEVTFSSSNPSVITVDGASATVVGIGSATITARQNGDLVYKPATPKNRTVATVKANQMISWGDAFSPKTMGDPDFTFTSTTTSNLELTFTSSNTDVATINGKILHIVGAGSTNITVSQGGNAYYNAAPSKTLELIVYKGSQAITFDALASKFPDDPDFTLDATVSSGLAISYTSSNTAVATVAGNSVHIVGAGTTTITAAQEGNDDYNAATPKTQLLTVAKREQTITFDPIGEKNMLDPDFALNASASSGLPVSYSSSNDLVATIIGNMVNIIGPGTSTITASQDGNSVFAAAIPVEQDLIVSMVVATGDDESAFMSISPNPATDRFTIVSNRFNQQSKIQVDLIDMYGRFVVQESLRANSDNKVEVSMSTIDAGLYFVLVTQGSLVLRSRLVKIH